jgi:hypothetical protein
VAKITALFLCFEHLFEALFVEVIQLEGRSLTIELKLKLEVKASASLTAMTGFSV